MPGGLWIFWAGNYAEWWGNGIANGATVRVVAELPNGRTRIEDGEGRKADVMGWMIRRQKPEGGG